MKDKATEEKRKRVSANTVVIQHTIGFGEWMLLGWFLLSMVYWVPAKVHEYQVKRDLLMWCIDTAVDQGKPATEVVNRCLEIYNGDGVK